MLWNTWPIGHYGPVLNYMAKCATDDCSTYKGDTGSPWFKVSIPFAPCLTLALNQLYRSSKVYTRTVNGPQTHWQRTTSRTRSESRATSRLARTSFATRTSLYTAPVTSEARSSIQVSLTGWIDGFIADGTSQCACS